MSILVQRFLSLSARARSSALALRDDERGATFIEYVIVLGLVAIVCVGAFQTLGGHVNSAVQRERDAVQGLTNSMPATGVTGSVSTGTN